MADDIQLRHRPLTGRGERIRESQTEPGLWLVRLSHGEHLWVAETDFIASGDEDYAVE